MSYVVLARKWRPQSFDDLVGQEHVSRTLANAIAHGPRGARLPLHGRPRRRQDDERAHPGQGAQLRRRGRPPTPCHDVLAVHARSPPGRDVDVQEIDGASYNGVDEVRRLQESLPYRPARDRFKIFIVDEVHMLSQTRRGTRS